MSGLFGLLVRELETLPHEPQAWQAAALLLGEDDDAQKAFDEIGAPTRAGDRLAAATTC